MNRDLLFVVEAGSGGRSLRPSFWGTAQILDSVAPDTFVSLLHRRMMFAFARDTAGNVAGVHVTGNPQINGYAPRLADSARRPVEWLLAGDAVAAADLFNGEAGPDDTDRAVALGFSLIWNFPSHAGAGVTFLDRVSSVVRPDADLHTARGLGLVTTGRRDRATEAFEAAFALAPEDPTVVRALRTLGSSRASPPPDSSWRLPFSLEALFDAPTDSEMEAVRRAWAERDLSVHALREVARHDHAVPTANPDRARPRYSVRIVSHSVHGAIHYGAILVPEGATPGCCGVLVEAHGVNTSYSGVDLDDLHAPDVLGDAAGRVILVVPSFRGEALRGGDAEYRSEGDPRNAWDGATDDLLALLNVVLATTPEANHNICALGHSRGGTVALLAALRDSRIRCAVDWAGPAQWFGSMGTFGFTLREQVEWALWERWPPERGWGSASQFIDWFLGPSIQGQGPGLAAVRARILASSPLYFVEDLPAVQLHYGAEDRSVPRANADALANRLAGYSATAAQEIFIHELTGHDQPYPEAYDRSRAFLLRYLASRR